MLLWNVRYVPFSHVDSVDFVQVKKVYKRFDLNTNNNIHKLFKN